MKAMMRGNTMSPVVEKRRQASADYAQRRFKGLSMNRNYAGQEA
jgi:hypothetical protein